MSDNFRKDDIGTNHIKTDLKDNPFSSVVKEAHKRMREAVAEDERRQAEEERRQAEEERRQAEKKRKAKEEREHRRRQEQMDAERKMKGRLTDSIKEAVNSIKPMDLAKDGKIDFKSEAFLWHIQNRISTIRYRPESTIRYRPEAIKFSDPFMEHVYSINKSGIEQHGFELYTRDGIKFTLSWKGEGSVFCTPWDEIISIQFNKSDPNSTDDHA